VSTPSVSAAGEPELAKRTSNTFRALDVEVKIEGELGPVVDVRLGGHEGIYFEHHTILWKQPQVQITTRAMTGTWRRIFAGLDVFMTEAHGPGSLAFSREAPGQVVALQLRPGEEVHVREHQFLLATNSVAYNYYRVTGLASILFGGAGFFIDTFQGTAQENLLLLHGYGNVFTRVLGPGEALDVEPGAFLWKDASVKMDTIASSLTTGLFGGTSFSMNRFTGPGRLGLQSMSYHAPGPVEVGAKPGGINISLFGN
jgi:uncharacterized protein (AIM24 family)